MSEEQIPQRDDELGAAIEGLCVPARPDGFVSDVLARIAVEEAASGGEVSLAGENPPGQTASPATQAAHRRWFDGRRLRRLGFAAVAAAALITVGTLFGISRQPDNTLHFDPDPATAREVIESTLAVTGTPRAIQGVMIGGVVDRGEFRETSRHSFAVNEDGDIARRLLPQAHGGSPLPGGMSFGQTSAAELGPLAVDQELIASSKDLYDADERSSRTVMELAEPIALKWYRAMEDAESTSYTDTDTMVWETAGLAAGEPYREHVDDLLPWLRLRSFLRQLLAGEAPDMREVTVDGRAAWELKTVQGTGRNYDYAPSQPVTIVIDQETRLPLRYSWQVPDANGIWHELRFSDFRFDDEVDDDAFALEAPEGAPVIRSTWDSMRRDWPELARIDFDDDTLMRETIGAVPGLPAWRPPGFTLADATWSYGDDEQPESSVLPGWARVSLAYRRGLDAFYISAEPSSLPGERVGTSEDGEPTKWWRVFNSDPFGRAWGPSLEYIRKHTSSVKLHGGAFDGRVAHLVLDPSVLPHLWVMNDKYTATVSGDLTQQEMIQVAESLAAPWMEE